MRLGDRTTKNNKIGQNKNEYFLKASVVKVVKSI